MTDSAPQRHARPSPDFDAKLARTQALLQRAAALLHGSLRLRRAAGQQCQHAEPAHDVQMVGSHGGPTP